MIIKKQGVVVCSLKAYNVSMIRQLEGTIIATAPDHVVLAVRGVGYGIYTTNGLGYSIGQSALFYTHLSVKETALDLYGFVNAGELEVFELLLLVPKVGPKSALNILSAANPNLLVSCILEQDPERLHKLSGIGKKTASNLTNYLHSKVKDRLQSGALTSTSHPALTLNTEQTDAIDALVALGFDLTKARERILSLPKETDAKTLIQTVLREGF